MSIGSIKEKEDMVDKEITKDDEIAEWRKVCSEVMDTSGSKHDVE